MPIHLSVEWPLSLPIARKLPFRLRPQPSGVELDGAQFLFWPRLAERRKTMGHSEYDPGAKERRPWNAGRKLGGKRALKPQQVWRSGSGWIESSGFQTAQCSISRSTVSSGVATSLKSRSAISSAGGRGRTRAIVIQQKTGRAVQFELLEPARGSIGMARTPRRHARRLRLSKPDRSCRSYQHSAVCSARRRVGDRDRFAPGGLRDAFDSPNQGIDHL